tara:strand:+ start:817 stop:1317 length:501 start_codon:yes stop_codon:yes gene_type:complete
MIIILKNNESLICDDFKFKCAIGSGGKTTNKIEGDKKTPKGTFSLGTLFYRSDRKRKPETTLKCRKINKKMGWCDDLNSKKDYNKLIKINKTSKIKHEKLFKSDASYDYLIPINYNTKKTIKGKGSAIFIHLTKNYKKTLGCVALREKDFLILVKIIKKNSKIKIS